jgi:thiol-disulfide isomerase/thioredoxin
MKLYTGPASTGFNYVNGSKLNDDLTSITNTIEKCQNEITRIEINAKAKNVPEERYQTKIQILQQQIRTIIIHGINDNINNELGYYLLTSYSNGWGIDDNVLLSLIHELPQKAKKSENILKLTAALRAKNNIAIGTRIIGFQMPSPDNKDVVLYNEIRRNKITIIDFWASWCGPCRESIPNLNSLYMNFHHRGLGIVGISLDSDLNEWSQAIKELHIKWTQMSDLKGWNNLAAESLGITSIPFNIIVDDSGIILAKNLKADEISTFVKNKLK